ncbi:MAG TPA: cyclic nucleotide-binding domain-containing protein [Ktedonobacterales bacterium]|nr:cyclic nucleotide-binding domain-containing protein [Ktedonobacterales bacterium]
MFHHQHKLSGKDIARWTAIGPAADTFDAQACADTLERTPFFTQLRLADRRALGAVGVPRSYPAGADLVHEGQRPGVGLYIIMRGCVRITQQSASDGVRPLAVLGPGEMFGELALLDEQPRSATATAIAPTLAFIIPIVDFRAVLQHNPEAAASLLAQISRRIRTAEVSQVR